MSQARLRVLKPISPSVVGNFRNQAVLARKRSGARYTGPLDDLPAARLSCRRKQDRRVTRLERQIAELQQG
jgi:hypothetical protein